MRSVAGRGSAIAIGAAALLGLALLAPQARAQLQTRWTLDPASVQRGAEAFGTNCGFCHGKDGRGSERGPDLLRSELVNRDEKGELIGDVLRHGRPERGMPPFPDLAGKAPDIASYLHDRLQAVVDRMSYKISDVVTGNAKAGKAYFQKNCTGCHSVTGDLAGIGKRYKPDILQAQIAYPGPNVISFIGYDMRPVKRPPVPVTVTLPSGETVSGTAVFVGEFDVSLRDAAGAYRSFAREPGVKVEVRDPLARHLELLRRYSDDDLHNLVAYLMEVK